MSRLGFLAPLALLAALTFGQAHDDDGHAHGPDGKHIVTEEPKQEASSIILSHHDLKIEGPDGKTVIGAEVNSTISRSSDPTKPIHTEKNAYEPENEVYGSHMTYAEPGEYLISQDVKLPDGKQVKVDFPVFVPPPSESSGEAEHDHHGPNYLLIIGGVIAGGAALFAAYKFGKKNASQGVGLFVIATIVTSLMPLQTFAQEDEEGHAHGPDGRHIVTQAQVEQAVGPQLRAYPGPNQRESATKTVDGYKFVLTIENEVVKPDRDLVSVSKQQMDLIGLKTASAAVSGSATGLQTTGKVSANPNGLVKVNSRTNGRVVRLGALPGTSVQQGQVLAVIESADLAEAQSNYRQAVAELARSKAGIAVAEASVSSAKSEVQIASRILERQSRLAQAGEFSAPSVERAKSELSEVRSNLESATAEVSRLEKLVSRLRAGVQSGVVAQRDLDRAISELSEATSQKGDLTNQLKIAQGALAREEAIAKQGLRNSREVDQARAQLELARSSLKSAESRLAQARADAAAVQSTIRVAKDQIGLYGGVVGGRNTITVTAPISAEVEHRLVSVGQTIVAGELLYDLLNADIVWVLADVYEKDVPKVRVGQSMKVVADAYPDEVYEGKVAFVHNEVDPQTRTTQVRIVLQNPGERLKQNMFVRVILGVGSSSAVTVPSSAVQNDKGIDVVFVEEKPGVFRRTLVQVKGSFGDRTIVEGVESGKKVVTTGSYQLLSIGGQR